MQSYLVGIKLLVGKNGLLITHVYQVTTLNVQSFFSFTDI